MIAVVDYGMGNLRSVEKGLQKAGMAVSVTSRPEEILAAEAVVLPGVGAFADAMLNLRRLGLEGALKEAVAAGKPFLGICLGLQLLFEESEEGGCHAGLGLLPGRVERLPIGLKVPHMGWNSLSFPHPGQLFEGVPEGSYFYFVHSYYARPADEGVVAAQTEYGLSFASAVVKDKIFGVQFHPEKSSALGQKILKNFGELVSCS